MKIIGDLIAGDKGRDIFRGQPRTGLPLLPKALRKEFQDGNHIEALKRFRRECWAFGLTATGGLEDLAIAQHSGLATYLFDWTTNPLVALFFACGEDRDKDGTALGGDVFVLNNPELIGDEDIKEDRWMNIKGLKLYNPHTDARLVDLHACYRNGTRYPGSAFGTQPPYRDRLATGRAAKTPELDRLMEIFSGYDETQE